jgi:hypothetical protein
MEIASLIANNLLHPFINLLIVGLLSVVISASDCMVNDRMAVNDELERLLREVVVA